MGIRLISYCGGNRLIQESYFLWSILSYKDKESLKRVFTVAIIALGVLFAIGVYQGITGGFLVSSAKRQFPTEEEIPNSQLIDRANALPEVKAFAELYKSPKVSVERIYGLDVWYSIKRCDWKGEECVKDRLEEPIAALMIRMDNSTNPQSRVLWCINGDDNNLNDKIEHAIVEYLRENKCI